MDDGTSSGIGGAPPPGVTARDHEIWPPIPQTLRERTQKELHAGRKRLSRALSAEIGSPFPNPKTEEALENAMVVYQFAEEAARRQQEASIAP